MPQESFQDWLARRKGRDEDEEKKDQVPSPSLPPILEDESGPSLYERSRAMPLPGPFGLDIKPIDPVGVAERFVESGKEMIEGLPTFAEAASYLTPIGGIDRALRKGFSPKMGDDQSGEGILESALAPVKTLGKSAFEMGKWAVKSAAQIATDPIGYAEENPLDVVLELAGFGAARALKGLRGPKLKPTSAAKTIQVAIPDKRILAPGELPSIVRKSKAIKRAQQDPMKLQLFAEQRGVPGAERGIFKLKENGTIPVSVDEALSLMDPSIPDMKMKWAERMSTPMVWSSKVHPLWEKLYELWHIKDKAYLKEYSHVRKSVVKDWKKQLRSENLSVKTSSDRIATYLIGEQKGGDDILKSMGKRKVYREQLKNAEWGVVESSRAAYDKFFERINRVREMAGKKPLKYVDNYFTFMRNLEAMKSMGMGLLDDATALDGVLSATPLKWANPRKIGVPGAVSLDFFGVFDRYARDSIQHIHVSPVVARGKAFLENFDLPSGKLKKDGTQGKIGWNLANDKPVLNGNIAAAVLSGNVRSAMIQFTALRGAITEAGYLHTIKGSVQNLSKARRKFATQHSKVLFGRDMDIHVADIINKTTKGKISNLQRTVAELGLKPLQLLDMETARASWLSMYDYYTTRKFGPKLSHADAVKLADDTVLRTQASGKLGDIAKMQRGTGGRLITMFQTFTTAEWNWIFRDVIGIKNPQANLGRSMVRTIRFLTATTATNMLFEDLLGMPSPFPAPELAVREGIKEGKGVKEIAGGVGQELLEQVPIIGSPIKYSSGWRSNVPAPAVQAGSELMKVLSKLAKLTPEKITKYDLQVVAKLAGLPGTSQAMKMITRIQRGEPIWSAIVGGKPSGDAGGAEKTEGW